MAPICSSIQWIHKRDSYNGCKSMRMEYKIIICYSNITNLFVKCRRTHWLIAGMLCFLLFANRISFHFKIPKTLEQKYSTNILLLCNHTSCNECVVLSYMYTIPNWIDRVFIFNFFMLHISMVYLVKFRISFRCILYNFQFFTIHYFFNFQLLFNQKDSTMKW